MPPKRKAAANTAAGPGPKRTSTRARRAPTRPGEDSAGPPVNPTPDPPATDPAAAFDLFATTLEEYQQGVAEQLTHFDIANQANSRRLEEIAGLLESINLRLDNSMGRAPAAIQGSGNLPPIVQQAQHDVLSRWPWVEQQTVEDIANGEFSIYDLPKLHRDESLRNRYISKSVTGVLHPLSGGAPQIVQNKTKLQASLKDLDTLLSAWLIYASIRTSYAPERGPGLMVWTERVVYFSRLMYEFSAIVNYVIAYFQKHQNSLPDAWFNTDTELHTEHLGNAAQRAVTSARSQSPTKPASKFFSSSEVHISEQVCHNWNRPTGCKIKELSGNDCLRRHVCGKCKASGHKQFECGKAKPATASA
jgi:hypothetical protein